MIIGNHFNVDICMSSSPDNVGKVIVFRMFIHVVSLFVRPDRSCYRDILNGSNNLDETYNEHSLAPTDDLIRF